MTIVQFPNDLHGIRGQKFPQRRRQL